MVAMIEKSTDMPFCIIPAAGEGRRFGGAKQLAEIGGMPLLSRAVREVRSAVGARVLVVTGAHREPMIRLLTGLRVPFTINERWETGLGSSIAAGVRALPPGTPAALVLNADQARVTRDDLAQITRAWQSEPDRIVCARFADSFGPPVLFPRRLFGALGDLRSAGGARDIVAAERERVHFVTLPNAAVDVDTRDDLDRLSTE